MLAAAITLILGVLAAAFAYRHSRQIRAEEEARQAEALQQAREEEIHQYDRIPVPEAYAELLEYLYLCLSGEGEQDLADAADRMLEQKESLQVLIKEVLGGREYLYRPGEDLYLLQPSEGAEPLPEASQDEPWLLLSSSSRLYFGSFSEKGPEGSCLGIRAGTAGGRRRYDYAAGTWKDGCLNGYGETGYCCLDPLEDACNAVYRSGSFTDDLLDGPVSQIMVDGTALHQYSYQAFRGTIVLDDVWEETEGGIYRVRDNTEGIYYYSVTADTATRPVLKNAVPY